MGEIAIYIGDHGGLWPVSKYDECLVTSNYSKHLVLNLVNNPLCRARNLLYRVHDRNRKRDLDGFLSACKPWLDGIVDAGILKDDNYFDLPEISIKFDGVSTESVTIDVHVENEGSIFVFTPMTPAAREWVDDNVHSEPWQWTGASLCVDHRFARDLAQGMLTDGLNVQ